MAKKLKQVIWLHEKSSGAKSYMVDLYKYVHAVIYETQDGDKLTIDPLEYFTSSGDAICKAMKLTNDIKHAIKKTNDKYSAKLTKMLEKSQKLLKDIETAKDKHCFIETEWSNNILYITPKDPRNI